MLRIDGNDLRPTLSCGLDHQGPTGHQRLLVGQGQPVTGFEGAQGGLQARGPHQCVHHDIHVRMLGHLEEGLTARPPVRAALPTVGYRGRAVGHPRHLGAEARRLADEGVHVPVRRQRDDPESAGMAPHDLQGAPADGPGGSEDRHADHDRVSRATRST
jgi:hypothetical protein